jgi:hypothetical protein
VIPTTPRLGKRNLDAMVNDFLTAWLVEGDIVASMAYVSERSYACLARNGENPADFDYGMAPVQLMIAMKAARDALGARASLDTIVTGLRLTMPALRVVTQPHHARFVIYAVPDDVAAYACYDLERDSTTPASTSPEDAGRKLRAGLEVAGTALGASRDLDAILSAPEPLHPAVRVMNHSFSRTFSLASMPNALADAAECGARAFASSTPDQVPLEYGAGFSMNIRFNTRSGDAPVMRMLWRKENGA